MAVADTGIKKEEGSAVGGARVDSRAHGGRHPVGLKANEDPSIGVLSGNRWHESR